MPDSDRAVRDLFGFGVVEFRSTVYSDLEAGVHDLRIDLNRVAVAVKDVLPGFHRPGKIDALIARTNDILAELQGPPQTGTDAQLEEAASEAVARRTHPEVGVNAAVLRLVVQRKIAALYEEYEELRQKAHAPEFAGRVESRIAELGSVLRWTEVARAENLRMPVVTDYVSLAAATDELVHRAPQERQYDEKFGLLVAPKLFLADVSWARDACFARGRPVSVAYADIDEFKKLNSAMTETAVDRDVLPAFMRALEAFVFSRGWVYREGGDEYLILLPNFDRDDAGRLLLDLQKSLSQVEYPDTVPSRPTISIGFHTLYPGATETAQQARGIANQAKNRAKEEPKGRVEASNDADVDAVLGLTLPVGAVPSRARPGLVPT